MQVEFEVLEAVMGIAGALRSGRFKVTRHEDVPVAEALVNAPRDLAGRINIAQLPPEVLSTAVVWYKAYVGLRAMRSKEHGDMSMADGQCELFSLFERQFKALTGLFSYEPSGQEDIRAAILSRVRNEPEDFANESNDATGALREFYADKGTLLLTQCRQFGGMKTVTGGQRRFGRPALRAVQVSGLYVDTQLIPDPIYPHMAADLGLNAAPLQLALDLFYILKLRPLVDARLPIPPVLVFPSFEEPMEVHDATTVLGMSDLYLKMIGPHCDGTMESLEDIYAYAQSHEDKFLEAMAQQRLLVAPERSPSEMIPGREAVQVYLKHQQGLRDATALGQLAAQPAGLIALNLVKERLRPQYHLLENAQLFGAQPLLSQPVHWHFFEKVAAAGAIELVKSGVMTQNSFDTLKALQDSSVGWLTKVPFEQMVEMRTNQEHLKIREELKKCTQLIETANGKNADAVVREVRHGLNTLVAGQAKAMQDIEKKYAPKITANATMALLGAAGGASLSFLPALAGVVGMAGTTVAGALLAGAGSYIKDRVEMAAEKKQARRSLIGILADARDKK